MHLFRATSTLLQITLALAINDPSSLDTNDRYIITLKPFANITEHTEYVVKSLLIGYVSNIKTKAWEGITHLYQVEDYQGYSVHLPKSAVALLRDHKDVDSIEHDQVWSMSTFSQVPAMQGDTNWPIRQPRPTLPMRKPTIQFKPGYALGIISHLMISVKNRNQYIYDESAGSGTFGYILGTGINIDHEEFEGRARLGYSAVDPDHCDFSDEDGHGTHVAGVVGGKTHGVAKKCKMIAVKVGERNKARLSVVIDGFQWAARDIHKRDRTDKAVVLFTLAGPVSKSFDRVINVASAKGVTSIVSGGDNGKQDATSPGSADTAITVSATDDSRSKASWADWGESYVSLYAPGVDIKSAWIGSSRATATKSGSSIAAGYVAGIALYFKGLPGTAMEGGFEDKKFILKNSLKDEAFIPGGTAKFAYNASGR